MRNRGIEIFMGSASAASTDARSAEAADLEALLAVAGVPGSALPEAMVAAHMACLLQATLHHRYV
jgi:midasin